MLLNTPLSFAQQIPETLYLASTDWCPYACQNNGRKKGIAFDYVQYLLAQYGRKIQIVFLPWSRAIQEVNNGNSDGLLTAVPSESPELLFTHQPLMTYQMCFYGLPSALWQYTNKDSLVQVTIGVMADYGYGEPLDSFIADNTHNNIVQLAGSEGIGRLVLMLEKNRIAALIEDANVMNWHLQNNDKHTVKQLGCLSQNPFYLALSPKLPWAASLIHLLDRSLSDPTNISWLENHIRSEYQ